MTSSPQTQSGGDARQVGGVPLRACAVLEAIHGGSPKTWGSLPHAVLYVRDALRLPSERAPGIPPELLGEVADRSELLEPSAREKESSHWAAWWSAVIGIDSRTHLGHDERDRIAGDEYERIVDPATSPMLAQKPGLRLAANALFAEGCRWADDAREPMLPPASLRPGRFDWRLTRDIAEAVAAEANVGVGAINGAVSVLLVEGIWWQPVAPQCALCSVAAADDPKTAEAILHEVFSSGLTPA